MIKTKLNVLYEDNHIIVVEKIRNVLSQKDITNDIDMTDIVKKYLKEKYQKPGNVYLGLLHRLDRRVGGVMVMAKSSKAASRLSEDIRNNKMNKLYLARVKGKITNDGEINIKLEKINQMAVVTLNGKESILTYHIKKYVENDTIVEVNLITGRYNQIRASFSYINHPIINDYKYDKTIPVNKKEIGLWCYHIDFIHPVTKEKMVFEVLPQTPLWK